MIWTFVWEFLGISREIKIPNPVKFEVINRNIIWEITKLLKDKGIYLAKSRNRKEMLKIP